MAIGRPELEAVAGDVKAHYGGNGFAFSYDEGDDGTVTLTVTFVNQIVPCGNMWHWRKSGLLTADGDEGVTKKITQIARKHRVPLVQLKFSKEDYDPG